MNKNCIIIFAIDEKNPKFDHSQYYNITRKAWESYCRKHNIDFIFVDKLTDKIPHPKWNKHCVFNYLGDKYEKIGMVDFDTMPNWNSPNFFDLYNDEFCGVIDNESINWLTNSINAYRNAYPELNVPIRISEYINSGVLFFTNKHKFIFDEVLNFYISNKQSLDNWNIPNTGRDQTILNLILKKLNVNKKYLDFRFNTMRLVKNDWLQYNWQLNEDKTPFFVKYSYIWHFTGCSIEERNNLIQSIWHQTKHLYE